MKATDLRIGNIIEEKDYSDQWRQTTVYTLDEERVNMTYDADGCREFVQTRPIPISEEWLLKFGFWEKYKSSCNRWYKRAQHLNAGCEIIDPEDEETEKLTGKFYYNNSDGQIDILYVHQLQNLYFALTGEELKPSESLTPNQP